VGIGVIGRSQGGVYVQSSPGCPGVLTNSGD
jgi:hypothetical protein